MYLVMKRSKNPIEPCCYGSSAGYKPNANRGKYKSVRFKKRRKDIVEASKARMVTKVMGQIFEQ